MSLPPLISSQRYLNPDVINRKAAKFKVFVVRTVNMEIRGKHYRVLLDGHHNLEGAGAEV
jgi:ribosomal protein S4E